MALDAYSLCPGGTGKKIKFCCPDFLPELEKIDRMIEGEQFIACIQHIDQLEQKGQYRACLMAIKSELLRVTNQLDRSPAYVADFVERFPQNSGGLVRIGPAYRGLGRRPGSHGQAAAGDRAVRRQYSKPRLRGGHRCRQRADPGRPLGGRPGLAPVSDHVGPGRSREHGTADLPSIVPPRFPCC